MIKSKKILADLKYYPTDKYYADCKLKLDANENVFGPPECILNAFKNLDVKKFNLYPSYGNLIDLLASKFNFACDNFLLTNGCDEALNIVINTFLDDNNTLLTYSPAFSMPKIYTRLSGNVFKEIKFKTKWQFNPQDVSDAVDSSTKIIYITAPNNPTGNLPLPCEIRSVANKHGDCLIVIDCTYINYSDIDEREYYELVKDAPNIAVVKSFSKDFGIAGLRLGFILANPEVINELKKVISPYSVNSLAVYAGEVLLKNYDVLSELKSKITESKNYLIKELIALGYKSYPSEANFVLCDFGAHCDFIYQKLRNSSVQVRNFGDDDLQNCLRISVPSINDAKYLISLIKPQKLLVFDLDGVVFDVSNSYRAAIKKTFAHFAGYECSDFEMQAAKNMGGLSNDWDLTMYLLNKAGFEPAYDDLVDIFQSHFYNPDKTGSKGLIDNEINVLDSVFFESFSKKYDLAVFTGRPKEEAMYSLNKYNLSSYFSYFVCSEDVPEGHGKPFPDGLLKIKQSCPHTDICFFGDTVDDIKSGVESDVRACGIIPPNAPDMLNTTKYLKEAGAFIVFDDARNIVKSELFLKGEICK